MLLQSFFIGKGGFRLFRGGLARCTPSMPKWDISIQNLQYNMLLNVCVFVLRYQEFQSRYRCTRTLTEGSLRRSCPIITTLVPRPYIRYSENKTMLVAIIWFGKRPMSVPPICITKIVGVPATSLIIWCRS